jgi:hypothetical protein
MILKRLVSRDTTEACRPQLDSSEGMNYLSILAMHGA